MKFSVSAIPDEPGCYQFLNEKGEIIYIGKAKSLKKRVSSYFSKTIKDPKTRIMVKLIDDIKIIVTNNESEAFLLEANLIRKHKPRYNIDLKNNKRYAYILLTDERYPRLIVSRQTKQKGEYFGPFISAEVRDRVLKMARMIFHIRTCSRLSKRACLRYHIGLCDAPCIGNISEQEYNENIAHAKRFLKGDIEKLSDSMERDMKKYSDKLMFEKAKKIRDRLYSLKVLKERQQAEKAEGFDQDIIVYEEKKDKSVFNIFNVRKGVLMNKQEFELESAPDGLEQFMTRFYEKNPVPKEIIIQHQVDETITGYLEEKRGKKVTLTIPKRGEKKSLLQMVRKNILATENRNEIAMESLKKSLKLQQSPEIIECFDISHIQGKHTVASMVQFRGGEPDKSNYRRFKIRTVAGINDYASIVEVVKRRYKRLVEENSQFPDLIVIDGGKGQLTAAVSQLRKLGLNIPTIALAKKHEEVFVPFMREPMNIPKDSEGSRLLQRIRDEAHRFAVSYHRLIRKKNLSK